MPAISENLHNWVIHLNDLTIACVINGDRRIKLRDNMKRELGRLKHRKAVCSRMILLKQKHRDLGEAPTDGTKHTIKQEFLMISLKLTDGGINITAMMGRPHMKIAKDHELKGKANYAH